MRRIGASFGTACLLIAGIVAGTLPIFRQSEGATIRTSDGFPGWPTEHDGRPLQELPLAEREAAFALDFPGRTSRFTDGRREIILRFIVEPTRRLHSASDCLHSIGYSITPLPVRRDAAGRLMGCFRAQGPGGDLSVCELVRDERGGAWPDVSAWYWNALLGYSQGPWWSIVVAEKS
ncbi:MAG: hypothetical protein WC807_15085 [Hyphomicrobium sp.]|jgi:hypothetical protein